MKSEARELEAVLRCGRTGLTARVFLCLLPSLCAQAQSLPPGVAACAAETDVLKRLSCFDREVAPYLSHPRSTVPAATAPAVANSSTSTPADGTRRVQARITSIDTYPDGIVLHLDNGQVWREDEDIPVDLGLRVGDSVTIEHQVSAFWVSGRNGTSAKVRLKN